jgi:hypothetical protein
LNESFVDLIVNEWKIMNSSGREFIEKPNVISKLNVGTLLTKRIPSILVARELFYNKYTTRILSNIKNNKLNRSEYRLWNVVSSDEIDKRIKFIINYSRMTETSNLTATRKLISENKIKKQELESFNFSHYFHQKAFLKYINRVSSGKVGNDSFKDLKLSKKSWTLRNAVGNP